MAQDLVALVRRGYEAANKGDLEGALAHVSPTVDWLWAGRPLAGVAEVRRALDEGSELLDVQIEVKDVALPSPDRVVAYLHQHSRWTPDAIEGEPDQGHWTRRVDLWTFNEDLAIRYEQYFPVDGLLEFGERDVTADPDRRRRCWQAVMRRGL